MMKKITYLLLTLLLTVTSWQVSGQFFQNFDSGTTTPAGWTVINGGGPSTFIFGVGSAGSAYSQPNAAQINYDAVAHDDYLVTPAITVVAGVNDQLSYYVKNQDPAYVEQYAVKLSSTTPTTSAFTVVLTSVANAPNTWTRFVINLTPYIGQTIYIGLHATSTDKFRLLFDDVASEPIPSCAAPSSLTASGITSTSVNLGWTGGTAWNIQYGVTGFALGSGTIVNGVSNPHALSGLTAGTIYQFYVQADCGTNGLSTWTGPFSWTSVDAPGCATLTTPADAATGVAYGTVALAWTAPTTGGAATDYDVYFATTPDAGTAPLGAAGNVLTVNITNTLASTTYYWRVVPKNVNGQAVGCSTIFSFTTAAPPVVPAPYSEPFTTTTVPAGYTTTGWTIGSTRGVTGNPGNNIYKNLWSSATTGTFTTIDVNSITAGMFFSFDYKTANYASPYAPPAAGSGNFVVSVSTNGGAAYTDLETVTNDAVAGWRTKTYDFSAYAGQTVKLRFVGNWTSGDYDLAFDNIKIQIPPTCLEPTVLTASGITSTSVNLGWTGGTAWNVQYGVTGFALGSGTIVNGATNPYTLTGLAGSTTYQYYVQSDCGTNGLSTWAGPITFTTACVPIASLPWNEGFEAVTTPAFPNCWLKENGDWVTTTNATSTYDADARTGTKFLRNSWTATNEFMWSPGFDLVAGTAYDFSFWWAGDNYAGWQGDVFVNNAQNSAGATQLGAAFVELTTTTSKTYAQVGRTFTPTSTGTYYFALRVNATGVPWYISFDDFELMLSPTSGLANAIIDGFSMYPNPVTNTLNIKALNNIDVVNIYNMLGQEVSRKNISATQVELDMTSLPVGTYVVKVQAGNQLGSYSLIKQ